MTHLISGDDSSPFKLGIDVQGLRLPPQGSGERAVPDQRQTDIVARIDPQTHAPQRQIDSLFFHKASNDQQMLSAACRGILPFRFIGPLAHIEAMIQQLNAVFQTRTSPHQGGCRGLIAHGDEAHPRIQGVQREFSRMDIPCMHTEAVRTPTPPGRGRGEQSGKIGKFAMHMDGFPVLYHPHEFPQDGPVTPQRKRGGRPTRQTAAQTAPCRRGPLSGAGGSGPQAGDPGPVGTDFTVPGEKADGNQGNTGFEKTREILAQKCLAPDRISTQNIDDAALHFSASRSSAQEPVRPATFMVVTPPLPLWQWSE